VHRDPTLPTTQTVGEPLYPIKEQVHQPLTEERKEVISTTRRTLQRVTYPAYPSLRNTAGAPEEKKTQNPNYRSIRIKTLTKNSSRFINHNAE
jgi:hypothetical protein